VVDEPASAYGDRIADVYDEWRPPSDAEIAFLAELARGGRVLELGIGTGRVAVPLAERGLEVHGVEASERLVERLRAKPGAEAIGIVVGDIRTADLDGLYSLVYAVGDTFSMLGSQSEQLACFERVAAHLAPEGAFVIECANPAQAFSAQPTRLLAIDGDEVRLAVTRHDPAEQWLEQALVAVSPAGTRVYPVRLRYVWPAELDLMARSAGLEPGERFGGWDRSPFTSASARYVAVFGARRRG
jgi:SAM-dependent methyltransferase